MATEGRSAEASSAPADLESAGFVHLVVRADGDALAASGLLARALADRGTPFQVSVGRTVAERTARVRDRRPAADDLTIAVGAVDADATRLEAADRPATLAALEAVRELDATPDPVLALAGCVAAGLEPGAGESEWLLETARERDLVTRRPGVAVPTADLVDGLAHSTRLRAPWSGDPDATRDALAGIEAHDATALDEDGHRTVGSVVALDAVGAEEATAAAAESIQWALGPYALPDHAFATAGGYADVLEATARVEPGTGAALAMGHDAREPALAAWREDGRRAHAALEDATTGRYDGLFAVGIDDGPVEAVARLALAFRSPEPAVLAVREGRPSADESARAGHGEAAVATRGDATLETTVEGVARELEDRTGTSVAYDATSRRGYLRYGPDVDESAVITTVRGLL